MCTRTTLAPTARSSSASEPAPSPTYATGGSSSRITSCRPPVWSACGWVMTTALRWLTPRLRSAASMAPDEPDGPPSIIPVQEPLLMMIASPWPTLTKTMVVAGLGFDTFAGAGAAGFLAVLAFLGTGVDRVAVFVGLTDALAAGLVAAATELVAWAAGAWGGSLPPQPPDTPASTSAPAAMTTPRATRKRRSLDVCSRTPECSPRIDTIHPPADVTPQSSTIIRGARDGSTRPLPGARAHPRLHDRLTYSPSSARRSTSMTRNVPRISSSSGLRAVHSSSAQWW